MSKKRFPSARKLKKEAEPVVVDYKVKLIADAEEAVALLNAYGSGGERTHVPFRPYQDTHLALKSLAIDLEASKKVRVTVHDLLIEATNLLFKKYAINHTAKRPCRSPKQKKAAPKKMA